MKLLIALTSLLLINSAFASTRDVKYVTYSGSEGSTTVELAADKTRIEYRLETEARTCYRREIVGYQTHCTPAGQCTNYPVYRDRPYTCYVTVQVPYEVFVGHYEAQVTLNIPATPVPQSGTIKVQLEGDELTYSSTGTPQWIVERKLVATTATPGPEGVNIETTSNIVFHEAAPYIAALDMSAASVRRSVLTYKLGATDGLALKHTLKLSKNPIIGASTIIFNDTLNADVLGREVNGSETNFQVAFKDLIGRVLGKGRYSVDISADFNGEVINDRELGGLKASKSILYKIN